MLFFQADKSKDLPTTTNDSTDNQGSTGDPKHTTPEQPPKEQPDGGPTTSQTMNRTYADAVTKDGPGVGTGGKQKLVEEAGMQATGDPLGATSSASPDGDTGVSLATYEGQLKSDHEGQVQDDTANDDVMDVMTSDDEGNPVEVGNNEG